MTDITVVTTSDQRPVLTQLVRSLPAILSGLSHDVNGIAAGFRARIGHAILDLISDNFNDLGRGLPGADGDKWQPLSRAYLAYGRRFGEGEMAGLRKQAGLTGAHRHAPGDKKGLLTADQLKLWRRTYSRSLAYNIMRMPDTDAKGKAAAIAWIVVKKAGAKTKLEVFGDRPAQILVDTGRGAGSLQPGTVYEGNGPAATYQRPSTNGGGEQVWESEPTQLVVGSNVKHMKYHHHGKGVPERRLWPRRFPSDWWQQILGVAISGLTRIGELYNGGRGI